MESTEQEQLQQLKKLQIQIQQLELKIQQQQQSENSSQKETESKKDKGKSVEKETPRYYELPKVLTAIDLGQIQGMLNSNLLAVKQYRQAVQECQLPDLKRQFVEASQMHLKHYNELLTLLGENGGNPS